MKKILIVAILIATSTSAFTQGKGSTLNRKWDNMMNRSNDYQLYKVIKKAELNDLWKEVQDTVSSLQSQLVKERKDIKQQNLQIGALNGEIEELNKKLIAVNKEKDQISFLGAGIDKNQYVNILWVIIALILIGCGMLYFLFKNSNKITVQKKNDYEHLFKSFEEYKMNKIELERKLRRELQTNMNVIEELKRHGRI